MIRFFLRSKIDGATVTEAVIAKEGSVALDRYLMNAADLMPYERVEVYNVTSGARFETYVVEAPAGTGDVCINGAAAHLVKPGDKVIIACYCGLHAGQSIDHKPKIVFVGEKNRIEALEEPREPQTNALSASPSPARERMAVRQKLNADRRIQNSE